MSVPDEYHHLFMDMQEEEKKKKLKPKAPMKRIKTITTTSVKRNQTMGSRDSAVDDKEETFRSSLNSRVSSSQLSRTKTHGTHL